MIANVPGTTLKIDAGISAGNIRQCTVVGSHLQAPRFTAEQVQSALVQFGGADRLIFTYSPLMGFLGIERESL